MVTSLVFEFKTLNVLGMNSKLTIIVVGCLSLFIIHRSSFADSSHCAFNNDERDWGLLRLASASAAIEMVETYCKQGDHLMVSHMRRWDVSYFIATMCDPSFQITPIELDEKYVSLNCVYAGNKLDRFE